MIFYDVESIEQFIEKYCTKALFIGDSTIGLGHRIYLMDNGRYFVVKEHFLSSWSSGHTIRRKKKLSKKDLALIRNKKQNTLLWDD